MNQYEPFMFYKTFPCDSFLEEEKMMEKQKEQMCACLPVDYQIIQKKIEIACDRMEYEGSRMYDEYPDKGVLRQLSKSLLDDREIDDSMEEIVYCFLCYEIFWRRCRRWKSRKYIK